MIKKFILGGLIIGFISWLITFVRYYKSKHYIDYYFNDDYTYDDNDYDEAMTFI